jgi:DNA-binding LacI/PurR family transcriptional regulator
MQNPQRHRRKKDQRVMMKMKPAPQYVQIYEALKDKILSGGYASGEMLPFERELCQQYVAQRITVRHALELLAKDGMIIKRPGVGSFVTEAPRLPGSRERALRPSQPESRNKVLFIMTRNMNDVRSNSNAYNSQLFFTMERACRSRGLSLFFLPVLSAEELGPHIENDPPACALLVSHTPAEISRYLMDAHIPVIAVNSIEQKAVSIMPDNFCGVALAMETLFSAGHTRIGYIGGSEHYINAKERYLAYRTAYWQKNLPMNEHWIKMADWTSQGGKAAMQELLELPQAQRPTAVMCASDLMAFGTYEAIQSAGLTIGKDISVMGFDNVPMCDFVLPHLCTVDVCLEQMTNVAMEHLLAAAEGKINAGGAYVVRIPVNLVMRESCGVKSAT